LTEEKIQDAEGEPEAPLLDLSIVGDDESPFSSPPLEEVEGDLTVGDTVREVRRVFARAKELAGSG
jgi:hypothetical protein